MVPYGSIGEHDTSLKTDTFADLDTGADDDVGTEHSSRVDLGSLLSAKI